MLIKVKKYGLGDYPIFTYVCTDVFIRFVSFLATDVVSQTVSKPIDGDEKQSSRNGTNNFFLFTYLQLNIKIKRQSNKLRMR